MRVFSKLLGSGTIGLAFAIILVSTSLLILKVFKTERRMHRYNTNTNYSNSNSSQASLKRTIAVGIQALLYIGTFLTSSVPIVLLQIYNGADKSKGSYFFVVGIFFQILTPLQGFSNALVYFTKGGVSIRSIFFAKCSANNHATSTKPFLAQKILTTLTSTSSVAIEESSPQSGLANGTTPVASMDDYEDRRKRRPSLVLAIFAEILFFVCFQKQQQLCCIGKISSVGSVRKIHGQHLHNPEGCLPLNRMPRSVEEPQPEQHSGRVPVDQNHWEGL